MSGQADVMVRVRRAAITVRGAEPGAVAEVAEVALRRALERLGRRWPEEWLFVRRLDLGLRARVDQAGLEPGALAEALDAALGRRLARARDRVAARAAGPAGVIDDEVAWFPTEGVARGALLRALLEGRGQVWPFAAMPWARSLDELAGWPDGALGDALAHALGQDGSVLDVPRAHAEAWGARWFEAGGPALDLAALPGSIRAALAATSDAEPAVARLRTLARLFAAWPPARTARLDLAQLDEAAGLRPATEATWWRSRAGGLVAWAGLFDEAGLADALWAGVDERTARAARWAMARALEAGDVDDDDPLVRVWAGERPSGAPLSRRVFEGLSPEALHAGALRFAARQGWLAGTLTLAPLADGCALVVGDVCVDHVLLGPDEALPVLVQRFVARVGRAPGGVTVAERLSPHEVDGLAEVDVMAMPDDWRVAARAAASVARRVARTRWRVELRELRGWSARLAATTPPTVELAASLAGRVPRALAGAAVLAGHAVQVRLVPG